MLHSSNEQTWKEYLSTGSVGEVITRDMGKRLPQDLNDCSFEILQNILELNEKYPPLRLIEQKSIHANVAFRGT
jgi:hypothetical protein